jgi:glycerol-3-phosphate acyltransferase PlsY
MRIGGKKAAALTLAGDALKGVIPVLLAIQLGLTEAQIGWVGLGAVLGHLFPVFFGFQGGKGVATTLGVVHAWHWPTGLIIDAVWLTFAKVFRISSAAALVALVALPLVLAVWPTDYWFSASIISALSLYRHKSNIQKLLKGEESAIGDRVTADEKT